MEIARIVARCLWEESRLLQTAATAAQVSARYPRASKLIPDSQDTAWMFWLGVMSWVPPSLLSMTLCCPGADAEVSSQLPVCVRDGLKILQNLLRLGGSFPRLHPYPYDLLVPSAARGTGNTSNSSCGDREAADAGAAPTGCQEEGAGMCLPGYLLLSPAQFLSALNEITSLALQDLEQKMKVVENLQDDFDFNYKTLKSQGGNDSSLISANHSVFLQGNLLERCSSLQCQQECAQAQGICMAIGET